MSHVNSPTADIRTRTFDNGVRVIVREVCTAPVVALNLWIGTGSVDDPDGGEGLAHFIEHMLFKPDGRSGTDLASAVYGAGGYVNAMTGCDHTTYYQVVPSETWRSVLAAQAAVVRSPVFEPDDVATERAVILEELRMGEASPETLVWRRLMSTGFIEHPCRRPVVGTEAALAGMTASDLGAHYDAHYRGGNMVLVVVGDVEADTVFSYAEELLGSLPAGDRPPHWGGEEPGQTSLRALSVHGAVAQPYLSMAFHVPEALHNDIPALDALSGLLGQGRSSRLRRRLALERGIVSDVSSGIAAYRDTGLFIVRASATTSDIGDVAGGIMGEVRRVASEPPGGEEMEKNLRRLEAAYLLEHETPEAIAGGLGYFELLGDCRLAETYIDRLAAVTPEDVALAARTYLRPENATVIIYGPSELGIGEGDVSGAFAEHLAEPAAPKTDPTGRDEIPLREVVASWRPSGFERPMIVAERRTPVRTRETLPSGATLITSHSETLPLTSIAIGFRGGHRDEDRASSGSTYLAMRTAVRGTVRRSGVELADDVESMGTSLATIVDRDGFGVGSTCLARLQAEAVSLLGEVALEPGFDPTQLEMARSEVESEIGEIEDHPSRRAILKMLPLVFPDHPYGRPLRGTRESLAGLEGEVVHGRYCESLGNGGLVVCASGSVDVDRLRDAVERVAAGIPGWRGGSSLSMGGGAERSAPVAVAAGSPPPVLREHVELEHGIPGQSHVALGLAGPAASSDDAVPLRFLARALSMMGGPLWVALRENPPHAYAVHASPLLLASGGAVLLSVTARPGDEPAAEEGLLSVLRAVGAKGLEEDEFERARSYVAGTMEIAMQRESTRAASYAMSELLGVGFELMEKMPDLIRGLTNDDIVRVARAYLDPDAGYATVTLRSA